MPETAFTPWASLLGGAMIGAAAVLLLAVEGRIAGISGILARLLPPYGGEAGRAWMPRAAFILGLVAAPWAWRLAGGTLAPSLPPSLALLAIAGLLVGFGAVRGAGCTSGHGVCGLARLSPRSLAATLTFMASAILTVFLARHVIGG